MVDEAERSGRMLPFHENSFNGYAHTPTELRDEILDALRTIESVPDLLGLGPHLLATARRTE